MCRRPASGHLAEDYRRLIPGEKISPAHSPFNVNVKGFPTRDLRMAKALPDKLL
jgi:hypothetical protein